MEKEYFTWEYWGKAGTGAFYFDRCTVVKPFGPYSIGDILDTTYINFENGILEVSNDKGEVEFKAKLTMNTTPIE